MKVGDLMRKFVGDILDDVGCFFARYGLDRLASYFFRLAEYADPSRVRWPMKVGDLVKLHFAPLAMSKLDNSMALVLNARDWYGSPVIDIIIMSGEEIGNHLPIEEKFAEVISESR